ncbi:hypothetical protein E8E13_008950 [Curvularia kusanoi]|uniref:Uncharacterized protein n=1 Tax=Curvularia kusanoi TaxID=90978 RepID=A0A9P4W973_CURKU|nr:hypothetical protein E8E13_008950 [Curvularia kusanoi]
MAGDAMLPMPVSPRHTPTEIGVAAVQWISGVRHSDAITERYRALAEYQWRPYTPTSPKAIKPAFKTPSNTTLRIENGEIAHLPQKLEKTTPNFHLLMSSENDSEAFCKSTLSAMLLNYPPPTAVNIGRSFASPGGKERQTVAEIREYLHNEKLVHDQDLLLIVDGQDTWFQLPSDAIIKQYEAVTEYANARLLKKYGVDESKRQKFNQTIVFGAEKVCKGDVTACRSSPESILAHDVYGTADGAVQPKDLPAKYLNAKAVMGPAKDLRSLFDAALRRSEEDLTEKQTMQSILTTIFGEQQLGRDAALTESRSATSRLQEWVGTSSKEHAAAKRRLRDANATIHHDKQYEYSIGLDYTHTLFQPLLHALVDEVIPLRHGNLSDLARYRHPKTITPQLSLPSALLSSKLPFWSPNPALHNPAPETNKPAYIDRLEYDSNLDRLPNRTTPWSDVSLLQNTYTGAIPALVLRVPEVVHHTDAVGISGAGVSFRNLWFAPHRRALLRQYFRTPQSPNGYHDYAVGGDRFWDQRGGRGGIWTSKEQTWLPWGEVDGVCGTLAHMRQMFDDERGVWMHELEEGNEDQRTHEEMLHRQELEEERAKQFAKELSQVQAAAEAVEQDHDQNEIEKDDKDKLEKEKLEEERLEKERLEEDQRLRKIQDEELRKEVEKLRAIEAASIATAEAEAARNDLASSGETIDT